MSAAFEKTVEELERAYAEAQERLSDPAVYNDHREAAEVGRRVKELEEPYKLAQAWRQARPISTLHATTPSSRRWWPTTRPRSRGSRRS